MRRSLLNVSQIAHGIQDKESKRKSANKVWMDPELEKSINRKLEK